MYIPSYHEKREFERQLQKKISRIPKQNKSKFMLDLLELIELAYGEDYENFSF